MKKFKLTVILKSGRTIVLTAEEEKSVIDDMYVRIMDDLKQGYSFITLDTDVDKTLIATDEISAIMISPKDNTYDNDK